MADSPNLYSPEMLDGDMPELMLPAPPFAAVRPAVTPAPAPANPTAASPAPTPVPTAELLLDTVYPPDTGRPVADNSSISLPTFDSELVMSSVATERRQQDRRSAPRGTPDRRIGTGNFASPWMIQQHERLPLPADSASIVEYTAPLSPRLPDSLPPRDLVAAALSEHVAAPSHMPEEPPAPNTAATTMAVPATSPPASIAWPTEQPVAPQIQAPAASMMQPPQALPTSGAFPDLAPAAESMAAMGATSMLPTAAHAAAVSPDAWFTPAGDALHAQPMHPPVAAPAESTSEAVMAAPPRRRPHFVERLMFMVVVPAAAGVGIGYLVMAMIR